MRGFLAALTVILCAGPVLAQYDTTPLFARGAWTVEHTYATSDGSVWCSADTTNRAGQALSLTTYDYGGAALLVFDPSWSLAEREVAFRIDVDHSQWDVAGSADGMAVSVVLDGSEPAMQFLRELGEGTAVAVYNDGGRRLATFSLAGSRAALESLAECWARITTPTPFGGGHDPFTRAADPF